MCGPFDFNLDCLEYFNFNSACISIISISISIVETRLSGHFHLQINRRNVGWLFNGTSTQKGQFVPTAREGNQLSRLRMANEIQCILPYVTQ